MDRQTTRRFFSATQKFRALLRLGSHVTGGFIFNRSRETGGDTFRKKWDSGSIALFLALSLSFALNACKQQSAQIPPGVFGAGSQDDCLPSVKLFDQHGSSVNLASLKGRLVLVDFIYTTCPGPCELMTAKLAKVADRLGAALGNQVEIVSITLDPEHDGPQQLLDFAKAQNAQRRGWLFLTGEPKNVEDVMASFKVQRRREPNGMIDHVIEFFLVGRDGRELRQYNPNEASPEAVANDVMGFVGR